MRAPTGMLVICLLAGFAGCGRMGFDAGDDAGDDAPAGPRLAITLSGTGGGTILGPDGIQCSASCVVDVTAGSTVTLRGAAATESWFAGWAGPCGGNFDCAIVIPPDATGEIAVDAEFAPLPNRAFVTGAVYTGALGGIAGADDACADAALAAGLDGTFVAYLSDSSTDAITRLSGSRGWVRTDGAPVADLATDFAGGLLTFPIRLDEFGNDLGSLGVVTGTRGGYAVAATCTDWSVADPMVDAASASTAWGSLFMGDSYNESCDAIQHLICVETGRNVPVASKRDTGRLAFVTSATWTPGGGVASADALCAAEASAAGQTGSFLAAVATTMASIEDRFAAGPPWVRPDGVRITRGDGMFGADYLDVAPELDLTGELVVNDLWTGILRWNNVADPSENCGDWTIADAAVEAHVGFTSTTDVTTAWKWLECDASVPLLCLEE